MAASSTSSINPAASKLQPRHQAVRIMPILTISGSPSAPSRSARLLGHVRAQLERAGESADHLDLRALP
ncbi:NADPH-dependent FMN reductase, partial [Ralstonia pseudosolanacearum]